MSAQVQITINTNSCICMQKIHMYTVVSIQELNMAKFTFVVMEVIHLKLKLIH